MVLLSDFNSQFNISAMRKKQHQPGKTVGVCCCVFISTYFVSSFVIFLRVSFCVQD